ncbi:MAG: hypothetical protein ACMXYD_02980 [Candidatus Woesearchaeota archaeon]
MIGNAFSQCINSYSWLQSYAEDKDILLQEPHREDFLELINQKETYLTRLVNNKEKQLQLREEFTKRIDIEEDLDYDFNCDPEILFHYQRFTEEVIPAIPKGNISRKSLKELLGALAHGQGQTTKPYKSEFLSFIPVTLPEGFELAAMINAADHFVSCFDEVYGLRTNDTNIQAAVFAEIRGMWSLYIDCPKERLVYAVDNYIRERQLSNDLTHKSFMYYQQAAYDSMLWSANRFERFIKEDIQKVNNKFEIPSLIPQAIKQEINVEQLSKGLHVIIEEIYKPVPFHTDLELLIKLSEF